MLKAYEDYKLWWIAWHLWDQKAWENGDKVPSAEEAFKSHINEMALYDFMELLTGRE